MKNDQSMAPKEMLMKLDSRNRIALTKVSSNLASVYRVFVENDRIILEPIREIPKEEQWLFAPENKEKLEMLKRGLSQEGAIDWESIKNNYE